MIPQLLRYPNLLLTQSLGPKSLLLTHLTNPTQPLEPQSPPLNSRKQQNSTYPGEHHCRIGCLAYLRDMLIHSLAAAYNNPATSKTRAHRLLPNQFTTVPVADSSQDTMDPITPGKAAAAFPERFASNLARL